MEAPEKIYLPRFASGRLTGQFWLNNNPGDVEYIRSDLVPRWVGVPGPRGGADPLMTLKPPAGEAMTVKDLEEIERLMKEDDAAMDKIVKHYVQDLIDEIVRLKEKRDKELREAIAFALSWCSKYQLSTPMQLLTDPCTAAFLSSRKQEGKS